VSTLELMKGLGQVGHTLAASIGHYFWPWQFRKT